MATLDGDDDDDDDVCVYECVNACNPGLRYVLNGIEKSKNSTPDSSQIKKHFFYFKITFFIRTSKLINAKTCLTTFLRFRQR